MKQDICALSATELLAAYRAKTLSPVEATRAVLARIAELNPVLNCFNLIDARSAMESARSSEARWMKGAPKGSLDGVPASIKDIILTRGWPTRRGSKTTDPAGPWNDDAPEAIWRPAHLRHRNGVLGLSAAYVVAADPARAAARWARFIGGLPRREGKFVSLETDRGKVLIGTRAQVKALLGAAPPSPGIAGYALACRDPKVFARRCAAAGLKVNRQLAVVLPPAVGGAWRLVPLEKP